MAKKIEKTETRDVAADLLGTTTKTKASKPAAKKKVVAKKATAKPANGEAKRGPKSRFQPSMKIKVLKKERQGRPNTSCGKSWDVLKNGMTVQAWQNARRKAGIKNPGTAFLGGLVRAKAVKVVA